MPSIRHFSGQINNYDSAQHDAEIAWSIPSWIIPVFGSSCFPEHSRQVALERPYSNEDYATHEQSLSCATESVKEPTWL